MLRLHAIGGLCNRLQAIISYRDVLGPIEVIWDSNDSVSFGLFEDVFEPLDGVTFVSGSWDCEAWSVHPSVGLYWSDRYRGLKPKPRLGREIETHKRYLEPDYAAMHVRRTDHVPNAHAQGQDVETNESFIEWAEQWPSANVYVATDNGETQVEMLNALDWRGSIGSRLSGSEEHENGDQRRNGTLADAVKDLFICAGATHFRGSRGSSFSETIERLRRVR